MCDSIGGERAGGKVIYVFSNPCEAVPVMQGENVTSINHLNNSGLRSPCSSG